MQNTYIFPARLFLGATLGAFDFAFGSSAALAQTADDVSQRLSAEQAKNAQLEKENAALRERLKMEENAQARPQVHHVNHAQQKTTPQQAASAALSDQTAIANSAVLAGNPLPLAAPLTCVFQVAGSCVHGWLGAGYLWFRANNQTLPPNLVTTPGGAEVIDTEQSVGNQPGIQVDAGIWSSDQSMGLQVLGDFVSQRSTVTPLAVGDTLNTNGGANSFLITGGGAFTASSEFNNLEANLMFRAASSNNGMFQVYALAGPKIMTLSEDDDFNYIIGAPGANFLDEFGATNTFVGGQLGAMLKMDFSSFIPVSADVAAKYAYGRNAVTATVAGSNNAVVAIAGTGGAAVGANTQVFTNDANIGIYKESLDTGASELNANLHYQVTRFFQLTVGYSWLDWEKTVRPGNQINPTLAPIAGIGGVHTAPTFPFATSSYNIQGVNVGGSWTF